MTRNLAYVLVESGPCEHCHKDASDHSIEGICGPMRTPSYIDPTIPRQVYRGIEAYAFVDLDSAEAHVLLRTYAGRLP
jgi:hypothetical protein